VKIYLLRHGQGAHNKDRILPDNIEGSKYNDMTLELTLEGKMQVAEAAEVIDTLGITEVYTSDQKRASQTAEIATKNVNAKIQHDDRLREFGRGNPSEQLAGIPHAQSPKDFLDNPGKYGNETYEELYNRSREFINELMAQADENANILLVGHGGQQCMIIYCLQEDPKKAFDEKLFKEKYFRDRSNASITMMAMDEYKPEHKHLLRPSMKHGQDRGPITTVANTKH